MMNPKLLLAALLILGPALAVHGCVVFQGGMSPSGCDMGTLYAGITDNGFSICSMAGLPSPDDDLYYFTCNAEKYAAVFDPMSGTLEYSTDHGNFTIPTTTAWAVPFVWSACAFCGTGECYVKTEPFGACAPSPSPEH